MSGRKTAKKWKAGTAGSSARIEEWGRNERVNQSVGAGFPRPDWSNRRNRRANRARRAVQKWKCGWGTEERSGNKRVVCELKSAALYHSPIRTPLSIHSALHAYRPPLTTYSALSDYCILLTAHRSSVPAPHFCSRFTFPFTCLSTTNRPITFCEINLVDISITLCYNSY